MLARKKTKLTLSRRTASWVVAILLVASPAQDLAAGSPQPDPGPETPSAEFETDRLLRLALDHWLDRSNRLQRIAQRLQIAGREICEETVSPIFGATLVDLEGLPVSLQPVARKRFGPKHRFFVTAVFPGMASERAGLKVTDAVLKVNGSLLRNSKSFYGSEPRLEEMNVLEIARKDETLALEVDTQLGCRYPASITVNDQVIAYATGETIAVSSGFMRYYTDDTMVAQVVGHELAHNILASPSNRRYPWASRRSEARADYVGIYLAAIAGYPLAPGFLLQLGLTVNVDYFTGHRRTHPTTPARVLAERKTIEEIKGKQKRGEPLRLRFE